MYRRYASLFFICGIGSSDNELVTLEIIHRYVEVLDRYFGNVSSVEVSLSLALTPRRCVNWTCKAHLSQQTDANYVNAGQNIQFSESIRGS